MSPRRKQVHGLGALLIVVAAIAVTGWRAPHCEAFDGRLLFQATGAAPGDALGWRVSGAGDVNGDGYGDVIVGAYSAGTGGEAFIYFGGRDTQGVADITLTGVVGAGYFGFSVSGAGDVNSDGYDDVIVGEPFGSAAGRAYVFYGGPGADTTPDLTLNGESANDVFGLSVSGAGDVNGDGFDDVIVGAANNDAGGAIGDHYGRAYVFYGGPGADAVADLTLTGEAIGDEFGGSVSGAGDVNGDGWADVVVGADHNDAGGAPGDNLGRAYVFYGGPGADETPDRVLTGEAIGDLFGQSVSGAGDVNGDGHDDVIVGAPRNDYSGQDAGRAYVFYGGPGMDETADLLLAQGGAGNRFGVSVSAAGDVNGDGYGEVVVGANSTLATSNGLAYVFYGGGPMLDTIADRILVGEADGDYFGCCVASVGDVDGDGFADVVVGANQNDAGGQNAGRAYVYSFRPYRILSPNGGEQWVAGKAEAVRWLGNELADLWISFDGGASYSMLAEGVGGANRNEFPVIAPTNPTSGARVRVSLSGSAATFAQSDESDGVFRIVPPATAPAAAHRVFIAPTGAIAGDSFGGSAAAAGDFNGDGYDDLVVGAYANDAGGPNAGRAYVFYGGPTADTAADLTMTGEAAGDFFGDSVAGAGDVNGDGYADVIIGARLNDAGGAEAGRAYVFFGGPAADATPDLVLMGEAAGDYFGTAVSGAGDMNGDGYADVIVGAYGNDAGGSGAGRAYIFFGGRIPDAVADRTLTGEAAANYFGQSVSGAGDVNGDGYADVVVGAQFNNAGGTGAGRAYVYYGGPEGDATADLTFTGAAGSNYLGYSVSGAGDVNGDGYDDVIVGAYGNSAGKGRAYVYLGGPAADGEADWVLTGEAAGDNLGEAVSGAGDVNADGYDDVVVGAWVSDAGGANAGRAYVFYGSASPDATADMVFTGEAAGDRLGVSVSSGGDLNGDGHDDIIVGADGSDTGGANAGRAYALDCNRYFVTAPNGGETWNVGAMKTIAWLGAERADLWLATNGGEGDELLASNVGGATSNAISVRVPHAPTKFARIVVRPSNRSTTGEDKSDSLFTIQTSVSLLALLAAPLPSGERGAVISWSTDPGPEDLAGYRLEKTQGAGARSDDWQTLVALTRETSLTDPAGGPGSHYRLFAVNGFGEELWLGEASLRPLAPLAAWPLPYRGGALTVSFATASAVGGGLAPAEVSVFDVTGRLVRTLARGAYAVGYQMAEWDGRDAAGRKVAAGVYFLRAQSAGQEKTLKLVVLR